MKYEPISDDDLPKDLNPGIVRTVRWLRSHGHLTCDSGDGETQAYECDRPYAYVTIRVDPEDMVARTHALKGLIESTGKRVVPQRWAYDQGGNIIAPCIQASYDPGDRIAIIDLMGFSDKNLPANLP